MEIQNKNMTNLIKVHKTLDKIIVCRIIALSDILYYSYILEKVIWFE